MNLEFPTSARQGKWGSVQLAGLAFMLVIPPALLLPIDLAMENNINGIENYYLAIINSEILKICLLFTIPFALNMYSIFVKVKEKVHITMGFATLLLVVTVFYSMKMDVYIVSEFLK